MSAIFKVNNLRAIGDIDIVNDTNSLKFRNTTILSANQSIGAWNLNIGENSTGVASGNGGYIAIGSNSAATDNSIAIGLFASTIDGADSIAIGRGATVNGGAVRGIAIGRNAVASFGNSFALGYGTITTAPNQFLYGDDSVKHGFGTASPIDTLQIGVAGGIGTSTFNMNGGNGLGSTMSIRSHQNIGYVLDIYDKSESRFYLRGYQDGSGPGTNAVLDLMNHVGIASALSLYDKDGVLKIGLLSHYDGEAAYISTRQNIQDTGTLSLFSWTNAFSGITIDSDKGLGYTNPYLVMTTNDGVSINTGVKISSYGNSYFTGGNVGIGTVSPSGKFNVVHNTEGSFILSDNGYLKNIGLNGAYVEYDQNSGLLNSVSTTHSRIGFHAQNSNGGSAFVEMVSGGGKSYFNTDSYVEWYANDTAILSARMDSVGKWRFLLDLTVDGSLTLGASTAPTQVLNVVRNVANNTGGITIDNTFGSGWGASIYFRTDIGAGLYNSASISSDCSGTGGNLYFYTANTSGVLTERIKITNTGLVGINTSVHLGQATTKLAVAGESQYSDTMWIGGGTGEGFISFSSGTNMSISALGTNYLKLASPTNVRLYTNGDERIRIIDTGAQLLGIDSTIYQETNTSGNNVVMGFGSTASIVTDTQNAYIQFYNDVAANEYCAVTTGTTQGLNSSIVIHTTNGVNDTAFYNIVLNSATSESLNLIGNAGLGSSNWHFQASNGTDEIDFTINNTNTQFNCNLSVVQNSSAIVNISSSVATRAALNLGLGSTVTSPTTGDIWLDSNGLKYKDSNGNTITL